MSNTPAATRGQYVIENWDRLAGKFVKIMPIDYKRALAEIAKRPKRATAVESNGKAAERNGDKWQVNRNDECRMTNEPSAARLCTQRAYDIRARH